MSKGAKILLCCALGTLILILIGNTRMVIRTYAYPTVIVPSFWVIFKKLLLVFIIETAIVIFSYVGVNGEM